MTSDPAEAALAPWQHHNARLSLFAMLSLIASMALWFAAQTPDGADPWYLAIGIEYAVWGAINLGFAISGLRGVAHIRSLDSAARSVSAIRRTQELLRLLRISTWLNVVWLTLGAALVVCGYLAWSGALVGHGFGVLTQAIVLTMLDACFLRELNRVVPEA